MARYGCVAVLFVCVLGACGDDEGKPGLVDATEVSDVPDVSDTTDATDATDTTDASDAIDATEEVDTADTSLAEVADTSVADTAEVADTTETEVETDTTAVGCLAEGHQVGDRYPVGDHCNFCDCQADGAGLCTKRTCAFESGGCEYDGVMHAYGERFPATDGRNVCVCAASGIACTRRDPNLPEEGAILLESMDDPCGDDPSFTGEAVLSGLPDADLTVPFTYVSDRELYPETRGPTTLRLRVAYEPNGYVVCRIPDALQPSIDMEVTVEWMTADGAFDEGFHTYLRRNNFGFVDGWYVATAAPPDGLDGDYVAQCLDPNGFAFSATWYADRTAEGYASKTCETDIGLAIGTFSHSP